MAEAGPREKAVNPKEGNGVTLLAVEQTVARPGPQTMFWQVEQENGGNVISLGDGKETLVKMENSQWGRNRPGDTPRAAPHKSQKDVTVKEEMEEQRCELGKQHRKKPVVRDTECSKPTEIHTAAAAPNSRRHTREKMPLFSRYGRKYRYVSEFDMILAKEAHNGCPTSEGTFQRNSCSDKPQKTQRGERNSQPNEHGGKDSLRRLVRNRAEETDTRSNQFGMSISYAESLQRNQGIQNKGKPQQCQQCGKYFKHRDYLSRHQKIHTGDKPFKCLHCSKCFSHKRDFNRHQGTHIREKPFQCPECGKKFCRKDTLAVHQRSHRRQKPYECL